MLRRFAYLLLGLSLCSLNLPVWAAEPLGTEELHDLVLNKTATCLKVKDQSECVTFFSSAGEIAQVMNDSGKRKDGRWFLDDSDRLCILWNGKLKPLCFVVTKNDDGSFNRVKRGKHVSTILKLFDGNTGNL